MLNFKASLLSMFGIVGEYLSVLFNTALHQELAIALPIATKVVAQIALDPSLITNPGKRDIAIAGVLTELGASQAKIGISIAELAVSLAYQKYKAETVVAPALTAPAAS
jgi:hypothetical protein